MNKIPRFITEYSNYEKRLVESNELMTNINKAAAIGNINAAIRLYKYGFITGSESIRLINQACESEG